MASDGGVVTEPREKKKCRVCYDFKSWTKQQNTKVDVSGAKLAFGQIIAVHSHLYFNYEKTIIWVK